jgi:hypothetical protein
MVHYRHPELGADSSLQKQVVHSQSATMLPIITVRLLYVARRAERTDTEPRAIIIASYARCAVRGFLGHRGDSLTRLYPEISFRSI